MDAALASFISSVAATLTVNAINAVGRRLKSSYSGSEKEQAVQRCLNAGIGALVSSIKSDDLEPEELKTTLSDFFNDSEVIAEVSKLLQSQSVNKENLIYLLENNGFAPDTLPDFKPDQAIEEFEKGFIRQAATESELQGTISATKLIELAGLQTDLIDLVSKIEKKIKDPADDQKRTQSLKQAYLNHLFDEARKLSLAGIDPKAANEAQARLNLDAVYTALLTHSTEEHEQWLYGKETERQREPLSALEQLNKHQHLVLLGDPGSGKSTFVNYVALCMCGEALGKKEADLNLLRSAIPQEDKEKEKPQHWQHGALLPARIILRDFAAKALPAVGEKASASHIWNYLHGELNRCTLDAFATELQDSIQLHGGLLFIDGLDEVPEAEKRREQIKDAVEDFARAYPRCRILVTSRTYAYQKQNWKLDGFAETVLAPFVWPQIRQFVERWYDYVGHVRGLSATEVKGRSEDLKYAIQSSKNLTPMAERPLLLTLMASLHAWRGGRLPDKREQLYSDTVELLLDLWERPKIEMDDKGHYKAVEPSLAEWLSIDRDEVRSVLNQLAFHVHAEQQDLAGAADIQESALVSGLMSLSQVESLRPQQLINYLSNRAGLLLPRGDKVYTFPHRTFQEYLAACHLTDDDFPDKLAGLVRQDPNRWREVALLAAAKAARGASSTIWSLVDALSFCENDCDDRHCDACWGAHIAGMAVAETADLKKVSQPNQVKLAQVKTCLNRIFRKSDFPSIERCLAGDTLARLGDNRASVQKCEFMEFCLVPAGPFTMGSSHADNDAFRWEKPQHTESIGDDFWLSRYPVTNSQFNEFVQDDNGYRNDKWWTTAGLQWRRDRQGPDTYGGVFDLPNHPVVMIRWYEAVAFTRWMTAILHSENKLPSGWEIRLPTEAEWEKAARGGDQIPQTALCVTVNDISGSEQLNMTANTVPQRRFPWGNGMETDRLNFSGTGIGSASAVGCFPGGVSPYGCEEMSGTVWEWCLTKWRESYNTKADDRLDGSASRVLRGGAFDDFERFVRCVYRNGDPDNWFRYGGFRAALARSSVL